MNRQEIYTSYLERFKKDLVANYDKLGLRASGKFEEELQGEIQRSKANTTKLIMWGAPYSNNLERGRSKNRNTTNELKDAIEGWIEVKRGLPAIFVEKKKQFAFIIARKIAKEGIKVPNEHNAGKVISDVAILYLGEYLFKMMEEIGTDFLKEVDFQADFRNILNVK
jgi:hypothetical protein